MKRFTSAADVADIALLVQLALQLKANPFAFEHLGRHKTLVLLFFNPSLRTRLSTQKAAQHLGLSVISLDADNGWKLEFEDQVIMDGDKPEHIKEAAAVISQYADIIGIRAFPGLSDHDKDYNEFVLEQFIRYTSVPVISLESATRHPLQSLADLVTIREHQRSPRPKVVLSWAPHPKALPQAVANSFVEWMIAAGVDLAITHPPGYELAPSFVGHTPVIYSQEDAFAGADFVYAKNWSALEPYGQVLSRDSSWMITPEKMALTNQGYFMHCLPTRRNVEVHDAVLDEGRSLVIRQAQNRVFAAQAVLKNILEQI